jgi:hypothetical protein
MGGILTRYFPPQNRLFSRNRLSAAHGYLLIHQPSISIVSTYQIKVKSTVSDPNLGYESLFPG